MIRRLLKGEGEGGIMAILVVTAIVIRMMTTSKTTIIVKPYNQPSSHGHPRSISIFHRLLAASVFRDLVISVQGA